MRRASSWTRPSEVRKLPRPASKVGSSSRMVTAASTASVAVPPRLEDGVAGGEGMGYSALVVVGHFGRDGPGAAVDDQHRG